MAGHETGHCMVNILNHMNSLYIVRVLPCISSLDDRVLTILNVASATIVFGVFGRSIWAHTVRMVTTNWASATGEPCSFVGPDDCHLGKYLLARKLSNSIIGSEDVETCATNPWFHLTGVDPALLSIPRLTCPPPSSFTPAENLKLLQAGDVWILCLATAI